MCVQTKEGGGEAAGGSKGGDWDSLKDRRHGRPVQNYRQSRCSCMCSCASVPLSGIACASSVSCYRCEQGESEAHLTCKTAVHAWHELRVGMACGRGRHVAELTRPGFSPKAPTMGGGGGGGNGLPPSGGGGGGGGEGSAPQPGAGDGDSDPSARCPHLARLSIPCRPCHVLQSNQRMLTVRQPLRVLVASAHHHLLCQCRTIQRCAFKLRICCPVLTTSLHSSHQSNSSHPG